MSKVMVIVLTGGVGSGKSSVARFLSSLGAKVISADEITHSILKNGKKTKEKLVEKFGPTILKGKNIDHKRLATIAFSSIEKRVELEKILHPQIKRLVTREVRKLQTNGERFIFLEIPLYWETLWPPYADEIWVVYAPLDIQIERLKGKWSSEQISMRINAQLPWEKKLSRATRIIDNSGKWENTKKQTFCYWNSLWETK